MSTTQESTQTKPNRDHALETTMPRLSTSFLAKFLLLVSLFLVTYRYSIDSAANIRYLYVLASATSSILSPLGENSHVEMYRDQYPAELLRSELTDWGLQRHVNPDAETPLSSWEFWRHSAERAIRQETGLANHGPSIYFVARASDPPREFNFRIVPDCGAIPSMSILVAAMIAFPVSWRRKIPGILCGLIVLFAINIGRLVVLALIGAYDTTANHRWFTFAHEYLWQAVFMIFVATLWLVWLEWLKKCQAAAQ